jgi:hypothetical protein
MSRDSASYAREIDDRLDSKQRLEEAERKANDWRNVTVSELEILQRKLKTAEAIFTILEAKREASFGGI